jgi:hypothetical protein
MRIVSFMTQIAVNKENNTVRQQSNVPTSVSLGYGAKKDLLGE